MRSGTNLVDNNRPETKERSQSPSPGKPRGHILIVDDEVFIRNAFRLYFESIGYKVETADGGDSALDIFNNSDNPIDVAILDLIMPGIHGLDLLKTFKKERPDVEVIIATGCGSLSSAIEAMRNGAFDYITKPIVNFDEELLKVVEGALAHRENRLKSRFHQGPGTECQGKSGFPAQEVSLFEKFVGLANFTALWQPRADQENESPEKAAQSVLGELESFLKSELGISSGLVFSRDAPDVFSCTYAWGECHPVEFDPSWFSKQELFYSVLEGQVSVFPTEDFHMELLGFDPANSMEHPMAIHLPLFLEGVHRGALFLFSIKNPPGLKHAGFLDIGSSYLLLAPLLASLFFGALQHFEGQR